MALSPNGEFRLKDAYQLIVDKEEDTSKPPFLGAWVWKTLSLPKVKHFLWQCCLPCVQHQARDHNPCLKRLSQSLVLLELLLTPIFVLTFLRVAIS